LPETPFVLFDDASPGHERLLEFADQSDVITALEPAELASAFARIEAALARGRHVAGWMSYELGYALEPRLAPLQWPKHSVPLLWFGVFDAPHSKNRTELTPPRRAYAGPLRHDWDEPAYGSRFRCVHDYIEAGDIYQANLSFPSRPTEKSRRGR
jgi:anthranilate/para-aminobenzoate synthase component I